MRRSRLIRHAFASRNKSFEANGNQRLESITSLFPYLPPHLFVEALNHPSFASTAASPEEQAAPLVDAILRGGEDLPDELGELKRMIMDQQHESVVLVEERPEPARTERRNIWAEEELDISRLRLGKDDACVLLLRLIPVLFRLIPSVPLVVS